MGKHRGTTTTYARKNLALVTLSTVALSLMTPVAHAADTPTDTNNRHGATTRPVDKKKAEGNSDGKNVTMNITSTPVGTAALVDNTASYDRRVGEVTAEGNRESGIRVSLKRVKDGTGHGTKNQSFVNSKNGFTPGDDTETDGYVSPGDIVIYELTMAFDKGKKRHLDILWSGVDDEKGGNGGVSSNVCTSSEAVQATGSQNGFCRYVVEEGGTTTITRQIAYRVPQTADGKTTYKWAPKISTSQGELTPEEVTVVSAPRFDINVSGSSRDFSSNRPLSGDIVINALKYSEGVQGDSNKGFYSGEVKPYRVEVDVSEFPKGTNFPGHKVNNGKIIVTMNTSSGSQNIRYELPPMANADIATKTSWHGSVRVLDPLETLDGMKNNGDGKEPVTNNNSFLITVTTKETAPVGSSISKRVEAPENNNNIFEDGAKKFKKVNGEKDPRRVKRDVSDNTELVSTFNINLDHTSRTQKMHLVDVWNPQDTRYDSSRDVEVEYNSVDSSVSDSSKKYTVMYTTQDVFKNNASTPTLPDVNDSSWTTTKPADDKTITGVMITFDKNEELGDKGEIKVRIPQKTLPYADYKIPQGEDGRYETLPDWYRLSYTNEGEKGYNSQVFSADTRLVSPVYPKPYIVRETDAKKDIVRTVGSTVSMALTPHVYDYMGEQQKLTQTIREYVDNCYDNIELSPDTLQSYDVSYSTDFGNKCGDDGAEQQYMEFKPKSHVLPHKVNFDKSYRDSIKALGLLDNKTGEMAALPRIAYTAKMSTNTPTYKESGYSYNNKAEYTINEAMAGHRTVTTAHTVSILKKTDNTAVKRAVKQRVGLDDKVAWELALTNYSQSVGDVEFIDVLPFNGSKAKTEDGTKNNFRGVLTFDDAKFTGTAPRGGKILYTNHDPEKLDGNDPKQPGVTWYDSVEKAGGKDRVTAIKVVVPNFGGRDRHNINVALSAQLTGNREGDTVVNQLSQAKTQGGITVEVPGAVSITTVASKIHGNLWWDNDQSHTNNGEDGIAGVHVYARRVGSDRTWTATTDEKGNYSFENLPVGSYDVWVDQGKESTKVPLKGKTIYGKDIDVTQTTSYSGNDKSASHKVRLDVPPAADVNDVNFGFMVPTPNIKTDKTAVDQHDNGDGTVTVNYTVTAQNIGTAPASNVRVFDSAESAQKIVAEGQKTPVGARYSQVVGYNANTGAKERQAQALAITNDGKLLVSTWGVIDGMSSNSYIPLPKGVTAVRLSQKLPLVELSDGTIIYIRNSGSSLTSVGTPLPPFLVPFEMGEQKYRLTDYVEKNVVNTSVSFNELDPIAYGSLVIPPSKGLTIEKIESALHQVYPGQFAVVDLPDDIMHLDKKYTAYKNSINMGNVYSNILSVVYTGINEDGGSGAYYGLLGEDDDGKTYINHAQLPDESGITKEDIVNVSPVYSQAANAILLADGTMRAMYNSYSDGNSKKDGLKDLYIPGGDHIKGVAYLSSSEYDGGGRVPVTHPVALLQGDKGLYVMYITKYDSQSRIKDENYPQLVVFPVAGTSGNKTVQSVAFNTGDTFNITYITDDGAVHRTATENPEEILQKEQGTVRLADNVIVKPGTVNVGTADFTANTHGGVEYVTDSGELWYVQTDSSTMHKPIKIAENVQKISEGLYLDKMSGRIIRAYYPNEKIVSNGYLAGDKKNAPSYNTDVNVPANGLLQYTTETKYAQLISSLMNTQVVLSVIQDGVSDTSKIKPILHSIVDFSWYNKDVANYFHNIIDETPFKNTTSTEDSIAEWIHRTQERTEYRYLPSGTPHPLHEEFSHPFVEYADILDPLYAGGLVGGTTTMVPQMGRYPSDLTTFVDNFIHKNNGDADPMTIAVQLLDLFSKQPDKGQKLVTDFFAQSLSPLRISSAPDFAPVEPVSTNERDGRTVREYEVGKLQPGQVQTYRMTATVPKQSKEQFMSNVIWTRFPEAKDGLKDPKGFKVPSNRKEFDKNNWGVDSSEYAANLGYVDDTDLYDGVPVYIAALDKDEKVTIGGVAWDDKNGDGTRSPDETLMVPGVKVTVTTTGDNPQVVGETTTGKDGSWSVPVDRGQNYTVTFDTTGITDENIYTSTVGEDSHGTKLTTDVITSSSDRYSVGYTVAKREFDVSKTRVGDKPVVIPGQTFKDSFDIVVRNTLRDDVPLGVVEDHPAIPMGMKLTKVTVKGKDGTSVDVKPDNGVYRIGDPKLVVKSGTSEKFTVTLVVEVDKAYRGKDINKDEDTVADASKGEYGNTVNLVDNKDKEVTKDNNGGEFDVVDTKVPDTDDNTGGDNTPGGDGNNTGDNTPGGDNNGGNNTPGGDNNTPGGNTPGDGNNTGNNTPGGDGNNTGGNNTGNTSAPTSAPNNSPSRDTGAGDTTGDRSQQRPSRNSGENSGENAGVPKKNDDVKVYKPRGGNGVNNATSGVVPVGRNATGPSVNTGGHGTSWIARILAIFQ